MITHVDFRKIDKSIEGILEGFPVDLITDLKAYFEQNISNFVGNTFKLDLKLVVDSSSIISNLISYAKRGESFLHKLITEPFLHLYAPFTLIEEVERHIKELSVKMKLNKEILMKTWNADILPRLTILNPTNLLALFEGYSIIGKRDPNDVSFLALSIQIKAHGIITKDSDIIDQPSVKTWKIKNIGSLISIFKKGSFSFFTISKILPNIFYAIFQLGVAIIRALLEVLSEITKFFIGLASGTIKAISKLPDWIMLLIGLGFIALIFEKKVITGLLAIFKEIGNLLVKFASEFLQLFKDMLEKLAPLITISIVLLNYLYNSYQETLKQISTISSS